MADELSQFVPSGTGMAIAVAFGSKEVMGKFLGPTAEYFGNELKGLSQRGFENFKRVVKAALEKSGTSINQPGSVPPRVLHQIMEEGFFCEDELASEYFGGVLASSRVSNSRDDRAASWVNVLTRLTTYQIRAHYILYMAVRETILGHAAAENIKAIRENGRTLILNREDFVHALELSSGEDPREIGEHIETGLRREELIESARVDRGAKDDLRINPTPHGISLLMWASGAGKMRVDQFAEASIPRVGKIHIPSARLVKAVPKDIPVWA